MAERERDDPLLDQQRELVWASPDGAASVA
jgi:hypothetical protein